MPTITPGQTLTGSLGAPFSQTISKTGTVDFWYASGISTNLLPAGLSLNSESGLISGTPTERKSSSHSITAAEYLRGQKIARGNSPVKLALKTNGSLFAWGVTDTDFALADPATPYLPEITGVVDISVGDAAYVALKSDGTVVTWHYHNYAINDIDPPAGLSDVVAVAAGYNEFLALKNDGTLVGWGYGDDFNHGIKNIPAGLSQVTAISVDQRAALALKSDGTVVRWGTPSAVVPSAAKDPASPVIAISLSATHALALKADGSLIGWGDNSSGQLNSPSGLTNVIAIEALENRSIALKNDGTIVRWGKPFFQEGWTSSGYDYADPTGVVAIRATYAGYLALKSDGTVIQVVDYPLADQGSYIVRSSEDSELVNFVIDNPAASVFHDSGENSTFTLQAGETFSAFPTQIPGQNDSFTWSATGLPTGLSINSSSGEIAGKLLQKGTITSTITRSGLSPYNLVFNLSIGAPVIKPNQTISLIYGEQNVKNLRNLLEDPLETYSDWSSFTLSGLPSWAAFNLENGGYTGISGTPQSPTPPPERGTWTVDITVTGAGGTDSGTFTFEVGFGPPILTPDQSFDLNRFQAFSGQLTLVDQTNRPANGFRVLTSHLLPPGLTVNNSGVISGIPTEAGDFISWISPLGNGFTDPGSNTNVDYAPVALRIAPGEPSEPEIDLSFSGAVGVAFDAAFPFRSPRVQAGSSLPPGLTLNLDRVVGMPQSLGNYTTFFQYDLVAVKISASTGGDHSLALKNDGSVIGWGNNQYGQTTIPTGLGLAVDIAAGGYHSLVLKSDGTVVGWGLNGDNQAPPPSGLSGVIAIAAGISHSLALKSDGTVVGWGLNGDNQAPPPSGLSGVIAIAAGISHSLALKSDGTVVGWGFNGNNRATPPAGLTEVTRIAAGQYHSLALKSDGTVVGWGSNNYGELTSPSGLSGVTDIAAGFQVSYALKSDGTVVRWGYDGSGQIVWQEPRPFNVPSGLSGVSLLSTGTKHSLALKSDGSVVAWGNNNYAQTDVPELTGSAFFAIAEGVPIITAGQSASGKVGTAFSKTFSLTDSTNRPVTSWSATGLASWMSFDTATGAISGTPQDSGSTDITLTATGPGGTDTETATIVVAIGAPIITSGQSFAGKVGEAFSGQAALEDALDRPADTWSATGLPAGLTINASTGEITGTPTIYGAISASATASNAAGSNTETVSFNIAAGPPIITAGQSLSAKVGVSFSATPALTDSSNRPATSWSSSDLPGWASINASTGAITGTPQDVATHTITLTATGPGGTDTETATIVVALGAPIINPTTFSGKVGEAFSGSFTLSDAADRPATSWSANNLPGGLTINTATGQISGTPTTRGDAVAVIVAAGPGGTGVPLSVPFSVAAGAPIIAAGQFFAATQGQPFSTTPVLTDATNRPATSWSASGLPSWAVINAATGTISGTPTSLSPVSLTITAAGSGGTSEPKTYIITVTASSTGGDGGDGETTPTMQLIPQQDFAATLGIAFNRTPSILSGTPVSWYATGLPAWATINTTTGAITGTPNFTGVNIVTVTAQDSSGSVSSTSITITTVSWNTLEIFIDPRARKILSRANTRSVMQKMFLKRDDLVNFQVVFINDDQPFGLPSDFAVTVGIKASYASEDFIAFSDSVNGTLSLASDAVQDLFTDEPDTVSAIFEVKWEDETSASRTASLPAIIQNTILRGNTSDPVISPGGGFVASGMAKYLAARQKILTGETAETTTLTLSEPLAGEAIFHRPLANNLPAQRGWITGVSAVSLEGDTGTEALVAEQDFVFYPDRQCFYFLNPATTGNIEILAAASRNFINFGVTIQKSVDAASSTSTLIDTASPLFEITSVSITSEDIGTESPDGFYFDRPTTTLFLETKFTCTSAVVVFKNALGVEIEETFPAFSDASTIAVPKSLSAASVGKVTLVGAEIGGTPVGDFTPFAVLEKTNDGDDILHLGWNYPSGYANGDFTVSATHGSDSFVFTFQYWPGNALELPRFLDNVHTLKIGTQDALVVFDSTEQKLVFCQAKTGTLHYTATHKAYEGLANGGETLQVVAEIPGVFATTAGTGHHISTLRTLNPSQDWYSWWYQEEGIYFVQIVDDKNVVIYQDDSNGAFAKSRPGYTAEELKPLTLKLPFAALWSLSPRDDTSLFQEAFTPNFATGTFHSATYPELDDTQRYAAESMGAGKTITLSINKTAPVRGVQGVNFTGPKPTYYAGGTVPYLVLATYKWFVVKCVNPNSNPLLTANKNYLLCVNNTNFDNRAIMVNITNEGYNIAADLYEIKGGN